MTSRPKAFLAFVPGDREWRNKLVTHLNGAPDDQRLELFDNESILAGSVEHEAIEGYLLQAEIVVLFISAEFLGSPFLKQHAESLRRRLRVANLPTYPLLVKHCNWDQHEWLKAISIRPFGPTPLVRAASEDAELSSIAVEILKDTRVNRNRHAQELAIQTIEDRLNDYDLALKQHQLRDAEAQSFCVMDVSIKPTLFPLRAAANGERTWLLETRLAVKNCGHDPWCVPAVFVSINAVVDMTANSSKAGYHATNADDCLPCAGIPGLRNVARLETSIHNLGSNEETPFVRWDVIDDSFIARYPVVLVQVETYAMPVAYLGLGHSYDRQKGSHRDHWLEFVAKSGTNDYLYFGKAVDHELDGHGEKVNVLLSQDGTPDWDSSARLRAPLDCLYHYTHFHTISLLAESARNTLMRGPSE